MGTRVALIVVIVSFMTGCCGPIKGVYPPQGANRRNLYIVDNYWHAGFVLPVDALPDSLRRTLERVGDARYVEIGWGDDQFYRSPKSTSGLALQAMFASKGSVIHAVPLYKPPAEHYRDFVVDLYRLEISDEGWQRLMTFIEASFERSAAGEPVELEPGWAPGSWFYRARGRYSVLHTCNQWAGDAIRSTGFPITPFYSTTSGNVGWQVRHFAQKYQGETLLLRNGVSIPPSGRR